MTRPAPHNPKAAPVIPHRGGFIRLAVAGLVFLALGWGAGQVRARVRGQETASTTPAGAQPREQGTSLRRRPLPKLRALDLVVDPEEVKNWASIDVARLGAKKWTDHLAEIAKHRRTLGEGAASGLPQYLGGWLAVVDEMAPYDRQQFAEGLREQICGARPVERALLTEIAPSLPAGVVPACPD